MHRLLVLLGLAKEVSGPALVGKTRPVMVQMYHEGEGWFFSWRSDDHKTGELMGPFNSEADAVTARNNWYAKTRNIVMVQA